jgi:hypothetical protein
MTPALKRPARPVLSRAWTGGERLYVIAACATVVLRHMKKGGRYGEQGMPNMESIRAIAQGDDLESSRESIEGIVEKAKLAPFVHDGDVCERLEALAACATVARNHAMRQGAYGAKGIPTMELVLLLASAPNEKIPWVEVLDVKRRWTKDPRTGPAALRDEVQKFFEMGGHGDD